MTTIKCGATKQVRQGKLNGYPSAPYLGALIVETAKAGLVEMTKYRAKGIGGFYVFHVFPYSPASIAKLKIGDVITYFDTGSGRKAARTVDEFAQTISKMREGQHLTLVVSQLGEFGQRKSVPVTLQVGNANATLSRRNLAMSVNSYSDASIVFVSVLNLYPYPLRGVNLRVFLPKGFKLKETTIGPWTQHEYDKAMTVRTSDQQTLLGDVTSTRGLYIPYIRSGSWDNCDAVILRLDHQSLQETMKRVGKQQQLTLRAVITYRGERREGTLIYRPAPFPEFPPIPETGRESSQE